MASTYHQENASLVARKLVKVPYITGLGPCWMFVCTWVEKMDDFAKLWVFDNLERPTTLSNPECDECSQFFTFVGRAWCKGVHHASLGKEVRLRCAVPSAIEEVQSGIGARIALQESATSFRLQVSSNQTGSSNDAVETFENIDGHGRALHHCIHNQGILVPLKNRLFELCRTLHDTLTAHVLGIQR
jgi:hypothetical protein